MAPLPQLDCATPAWSTRPTRRSSRRSVFPPIRRLLPGCSAPNRGEARQKRRRPRSSAPSPGGDSSDAGRAAPRLTAPERLPLGRISGDQLFVLTLRPLVVLLLFPHANEAKPGCGRKIAAAGIAKVFEILPGRVRLPRFQMQSAKVLPWSRGRRVRRSCASTPGLATCRSGCAARWLCNTAAASSICPFSMSSVARC